LCCRCAHKACCGCQVSDFGLSRESTSDTYYISKGGALPVRWCAPEVSARTHTHLVVRSLRAFCFGPPRYWSNASSRRRRTCGRLAFCSTRCGPKLTRPTKASACACVCVCVCAFQPKSCKLIPSGVNRKQQSEGLGRYRQRYVHVCVSAIWLASLFFSAHTLDF
jgi:hypothetical protein